MKLFLPTLLILLLFNTACTGFTKGKNMSQVTHTHHAIDYIEFNVTDMEASKKFYSSAFDWKFTDYAPSYVGIQKADGGEYGGFSLVDTFKPGGSLIVLYSSNLTETLTKVLSSGGEITREIFEFPGGKRFQFKDPSGNELAVWSDK